MISPLFADAEQAALTLVERYGSFGLICCMVLGFTFYVIPKTITAFRDLAALFQEELKAERASREELSMKHTEVLTTLALQVQRLTDRTTEHRPLAGG
jgi:hypothetical protein